MQCNAVLSVSCNYSTAQGKEAEVDIQNVKSSILTGEHREEVTQDVCKSLSVCMMDVVMSTHKERIDIAWQLCSLLCSFNHQEIKYLAYLIPAQSMMGLSSYFAWYYGYGFYGPAKYPLLLYGLTLACHSAAHEKDIIAHPNSVLAHRAGDISRIHDDQPRDRMNNMQIENEQKERS